MEKLSPAALSIHHLPSERDILFSTLHIDPEFVQKREIFDTLWKDIKFLYSITIIPQDDEYTTLWALLEHNLTANFPDFFDSDKKLNDFSLDELSFMDSYVVKFFQSFLHKFEKTDFTQNISHQHMAFYLTQKLLSATSVWDFGPSMSDIHWMSDYYRDIERSFWNPLPKSLDDYESYQESDSDNHVYVSSN